MQKVRGLYNKDKWVLDESEIIECVEKSLVLTQPTQGEQQKAVVRAEKEILKNIINQLIYKGIITRREIQEKDGSVFEYKLVAIKQFL